MNGINADNFYSQSKRLFMCKLAFVVQFVSIYNSEHKSDINQAVWCCRVTADELRCSEIWTLKKLVMIKKKLSYYCYFWKKNNNKPLETFKPNSE